MKRNEIAANVEHRVALELIDSLNKDVKALEIIKFHENVARAQRQAYNRHRQDANELSNKILIEVDFKQKIVIGFGPRQMNTEYYAKFDRLRTCLGTL